MFQLHSLRLRQTWALADGDGGAAEWGGLRLTDAVRMAGGGVQSSASATVFTAQGTLITLRHITCQSR